MEGVVSRPAFFSRPKGIILAVAVAVIIWYANPVSPVTLVLAAVAFFFILGLKRPVWAVAAFLISEMTLTSHMISTPFGFDLSLRLLLLLSIGLILFRSLVRNDVMLGPRARQVLIPVLLFFGLSIIANLVGPGFGDAFTDFRYMAAGILIVIFLPVVTRKLEDLKLLCIVVLIGMTVSSVIALMQHYEILGMGDSTIIPGVIALKGNRVPGISEEPLYLAFTLPVAASAVFAVSVAGSKNIRTKWGLLALFLLMGLALYFTYTRSALLGLGFGLLAIPLFLKTGIKWSAIILAMFLIIILIETTGVMESQYVGGRAESEQDSSAYERQVLWQASMAIIADNPILGIGAGQFRIVSPQYASAVDPELMREQETYWEYRTLGSRDPHNDLLSVWVSYGTLALAVYLWLFIAISQSLFYAYRVTKWRFIKGLSIGLAAGLVTYVINAFYHNCLVAMPLFWILAGFSVATAKLALYKGGAVGSSSNNLKRE